MSFAVAAGYWLRTLLFRVRLRRRPKGTVLVFDRYFYDSFAHFEVNRGGLPMALLARLTPPPTVGAVLLVGEQTIRERRSRYSPEYANQVVRAYEELSKRFPGLLVARTDSFDAVGEIADRIVAGVLARRQQHG
jgi:thymidylate kinase